MILFTMKIIAIVEYPANNNLNGLNNFVDYNILISNIVYSKNQNAFKV